METTSPFFKGGLRGISPAISLIMFSLTMPDKYRNFKHLLQHETEGEDFEIAYQPRNSDILVMAPHGGKIEPYTGELAEMIANDTFSCYVFKGMKRNGNRSLHITSHCFDEPVAIRAVQGARLVLTVHGEGNPNHAFIMVGGTHKPLCSVMETRLSVMGTDVRSPPKGMGAKHLLNICNRGKSGKGVQLELSYKLRLLLKNDTRWQRQFADTVRAVLLEKGSTPIHK